MCNAKRYADCMAQLVVRIPAELLGQIDEAVGAEGFDSRSEVARAALFEFFDRRRREAIGRAIVEGYERIPETDEELAWAERAAREMIREEPW